MAAKPKRCRCSKSAMTKTAAGTNWCRVWPDAGCCLMMRRRSSEFRLRNSACHGQDQRPFADRCRGGMLCGMKFTTRTLLLAAPTVVLLAGCIERTVTIRTEPDNALVYLNDEEVGRSPVTV